MDGKILLLAIAAILLTANAAAANTWANTPNMVVDVNGGYDNQTATAADQTEDGIQCVPDDGNFTVNIQYANPKTGINVTYFAAAGGTTSVNIRGTMLDGNGYSEAADTFHVNALGHGQFSVAAPIAEGVYRMRVYDANAVDVNYYDEWIAVKPDSTYSEFTFSETGDSNDFCKINNYSTFRGTISDDSGYGKLQTVEAITLDLSGYIDFDTGIDLAANELKFNLSTLRPKKGKITCLRPGIRTTQYQIRRNDSGCSICGNEQSNNGQISFNTTSINDSPVIYSAVELSTGDGGTGGGILPIGGGQFQAALPSLAGIADTNTILLIVGALFVGIGIYVYIKKK